MLLLCHGRSCLLILLGLFFSSTTFAGEFNEIISIGDPLPTFTDLPTVDEQSISSSDIEEEILVLVSMSNGCPFSKGIESDLIKLVDKFHDQSVKVIALNVSLSEDDLMPKIKQRALDRNFNFSYIRDDSQELGRQLGTTTTPEFFVFNKERNLIYMGLLHDSPAMSLVFDKFVYLKGEPEQFYVEDAITRSFHNKAVVTQETAPKGCTIIYENDLEE